VRGRIDALSVRVATPTALGNEMAELSMIEGISAVTLGTHEMPRAVRFYRALGFEVLHGGEESIFTSFRAGTSYLNLIAQPAERRWSWWGRVILYVADVDALYDRALAAGCQPATAPRDAEWGERFFHLIDPDGHELSFARPLLPVSSNSSSKRPAIPGGAGRAYGAPIIR
jgi:uncharacterized glyoxalase superfamily protein PhnB